MISVRPTEDRNDVQSGGSQPQPQVVIFATPAAEILVVTVDPLVIAAGDADVIAEQLGPGPVADPAIDLALGVELEEPPSLDPGVPLGKIAAAYVVLRDPGASRL